MLTLLKIKNLALVDQLLWEPSSGFICITGETGAGKSVIIGAIRLALGERADKTLIRSGEQQCSVEAVFHLPESSPVHAILNEHGVPPCEDGNLIIKRLISSTANRQFLNDSPCTLNLLREAGACLVDMHGPSDHRSLVSQERQLSLLDAFGEHAPLVHAYSDAWRQWQDARRAYDDLEHAEAATAREIELLRHQVDEIDSAAFTPEEVLTLEERWQRARNGTRLREQVSKMLSMLEETDVPGLGTQLRELTRAAHELERMDASTAAWLAPLAGVNLELKEIEGRLADYSAELDCDPRELFQLEERINLDKSRSRRIKANRFTNREIREALDTPGYLDKKQTTEFATELPRRASFSLACIVFALIGVPLAINTRRKDTSTGFALGILIASLYFLALIFADLSRKNDTMLPYILLWLPNIITVAVALHLHKRARHKG